MNKTRIFAVAATVAVVLSLLIILPAHADCVDPVGWTVRNIHVTTPGSTPEPDAQATIRWTVDRVSSMFAERELAIRWETAHCEPVVHTVHAADSSFTAVEAAVAEAGLVQHGRQIAWVDGDADVRGLAVTPADPLNATRPTAVVYRWGHRTAAHELLHTLGAVHPDAPSAYGDSHHTMGFDVMCELCTPTPGFECSLITLDCQGDSYLSLDPIPGGFLATNPALNVANHPILERQDSGPVAESVPEPTFPDVTDHPHRAAIEELAELGVVEGYADGTFGPEDPITRAQAAVMFKRMLEEIR